MLKKFMFAMVPMIMLAGTACGEDDLLSKIGSMDVNSIGNASAEVEEFDLGDVDVDDLLAENDSEGEEDAIAACFRRIRYGYGGSYGHRHYSYSYNWHRPCYTSHYTYTYYRPLYCYQPVHYTTYTPVYTNYWGCY
tara:strand:+ start:1822 stop:2229 length:408 start_codon:yes stop_codon:yes gene_type:complete